MYNNQFSRLLISVLLSFGYLSTANAAGFSVGCLTHAASSNIITGRNYSHFLVQ